MDGSGGVTVAIDSTVATLSGVQTLTNEVDQRLDQHPDQHSELGI
jgi:hypothetical protein